MGDPQDPVANAPARAVIPGTGAPQRQKRLLNNVLRKGATSDHAVASEKAASTCRSMTISKRGRFILADEFHQLLVRKLAQFCRRRVELAIDSGHLPGYSRQTRLRINMAHSSSFPLTKVIRAGAGREHPHNEAAVRSRQVV